MDSNIQKFWAQVLQEYGTKVENGKKSNMLAMEESEKSWKGSWILMFKNFELKCYRKMGLKKRMGEKSNMLAMEESEKSWKCSRIQMFKNF